MLAKKHQSQEIIEKNITMTRIIYLLYAFTFFSAGISSIIAVIINYIKLSEVSDTYLESHFKWQINTFWITFGVSIIGIVTTFILIGFVILGFLSLWYLYRIIKGFMYLNEGKDLYITEDNE